MYLLSLLEETLDLLWVVQLGLGRLEVDNVD